MNLYFCFLSNSLDDLCDSFSQKETQHNTINKIRLTLAYYMNIMIYFNNHQAVWDGELLAGSMLHQSILIQYLHHHALWFIEVSSK